VSKGKGKSAAGGSAVLTPPVCEALQVGLLSASARLLELAFGAREREDAITKLWEGARQAKADIMTLLGKSAGDEPPDFTVAATAIPGEPHDPAAVAVVASAYAILGAEAAEIITEEAYGP